MKWRRISEEEVFLTLENPNRVEESIKGRKNAYKSIGKRYLKVTYKEFFLRPVKPFVEGIIGMVVFKP